MENKEALEALDKIRNRFKTKETHGAFECIDEWIKTIRAALEQPSNPRRLEVPEGYALVPIEPIGTDNIRQSVKDAVAKIGRKTAAQGGEVIWV
jgi:hypothetical protein